MEIAFGYCHCGCGEKTNICQINRPSHNLIKGAPRIYLKGHHQRLSPVDYIVEGRGYKTPCWIWQLGTNGSGYGMLTRGVRMVAHKWYWQRKNGPVPEGLELDHLCRVPRCVNPDHLDPVTNIENLRRGKSTKLTPESVRVIRLMRSQKSSTYLIARTFRISQSLVMKVLTGRAWIDII